MKITTQEDAREAARELIVEAVSGRTSRVMFQNSMGEKTSWIEVTWTTLESDTSIEGMYFHLSGEVASKLKEWAFRRYRVDAWFQEGTLGWWEYIRSVEIVSAYDDEVVCSVDTLDLIGCVNVAEYHFDPDRDIWIYRPMHAPTRMEVVTHDEVMTAIRTNPVARVNDKMLIHDFDTVDEFLQWAGEVPTLPQEIIDKLGGTSGAVTFITKEGLRVQESEVLFQEIDDPGDNTLLPALLVGDVEFTKDTEVDLHSVRSFLLDATVTLDTVAKVVPARGEKYSAILINPAIFGRIL